MSIKIVYENDGVFSLQDDIFVLLKNRIESPMTPWVMTGSKKVVSSVVSKLADRDQMCVACGARDS